MASTNKSVVQALAASALGLSVGFGAGVQPAPGGMERIRHSSGGAAVFETWTVPPNGIAWEILVNKVDGQDQVVPGYPFMAVPPALPGEPGAQSIMAAANAWTTGAIVRYVSSQGVPVNVPVSALRLAAPALTPTTVTPARSNVDLVNTVSCWDGPVFWTAVGGASALAVTLVRVDNSTGSIQEADIHVNTSSIGAGGKPAFCFLENQGGTWHGSMSPAPDSSFSDPATLYADLQGIVTHEFGHFAGLGHSHVDATADATGSLFPTMFPFAQGAVHGNVQVTGSTSPNAFFNATADLSKPQSTGLHGGSAATLEQDDLSAIGDAYPTAAMLQNLGSIEGAVFKGVSNLRAVHVVAFREGDPDKTRVGATAHDYNVITGTGYRIRGLPPGKYHVYIEEFSFDSRGTLKINSPRDGYVPTPSGVPNFVDGSGSSYLPTYKPFGSPAVDYLPWVDTEFYNGPPNAAGGEQAIESSHAESVAQNVTAGAVTRVLLEHEHKPNGYATNPFRVGLASGQQVMRGRMFLAAGDTFTLSQTGYNAGDLLFILMSTKRKISPWFAVPGAQPTTDLLQIDPLDAATSIITVSAPATGQTWQYAYTLPVGAERTNLFFQAVGLRKLAQPVNGNTHKLWASPNVINVWAGG